ncbi:MAG: acetyl-CoA decarbonylase/synthase complex subunit alpha/beta, partial [Nitrospirota bacterium]
MSKIIATAAIRASHKIVEQAEFLVDKAILEKGGDQTFEFPDTGYYLPMMYANKGFAVKTIKEMKIAVEMTKGLLAPEPDENVYRPYLGEALDAGMATMFAQEIIMAVRYIYGIEPYRDEEFNITYNGFISDSILRDLGIQLVDGTMPGYVCIVGAARDDDTAVKIVKELQEKNILIFLCGHVNGESVTKQLIRKDIELGWATRVVPLGPDTSHAIYALNWAARASMTFGGVKPGDYKKILKYSKDRVFAFALVCGVLDDLKWATGAGAINMGFPAICDTDVPVIHPTGVTIYEEVEKQLDPEKLVQTAIEVRGLKIIVDKPPIPVAFGPAFEGERIRKDDVFIEWGGNKTPAFQVLYMRELDEVEDGKTEIIGTKNTDVYTKGGTLPLGFVVEVAGRKMEKDFEPVIERKLHDFINEAQGVWEMGQRDIIWGRISKTAFNDGFRLEHLAQIYAVMVKSSFPAIIDKVQVTLYTDEEDVVQLQEEARKVYKERTDKIANMTDESIDTFYSCILCQSFAPTHVCVISPERIGLCGAYTWLDCKASYEINPTGPNQPIKKGETSDPVKGKWENVDEYVSNASGGNLPGFSAYSIMDNPMTSCGCFECIIAVVPEANGVMIVDRGYTGITPIGMKFSTIAGTVGGGVQTPGFMGVGKYFLTSKKFLYADGGLRRIVWMTKGLKDAYGEEMKKRTEEEGCPELLDKIADETVTTDIEELLNFLSEKGHPAPEM